MPQASLPFLLAEYSYELTDAGLIRGGAVALPSEASWRASKEYYLNRSEEHTSELQSLTNLVCRLLLEKKKKKHIQNWNTQMREMRMRLEGCHNRRHDARDVFRSASCHLMTEAGAQP